MSINKITICAVSLTAMLALTGCHQRVEPVSGMEKQMSCAELQKEIKRTEKVKKNIESNRGISARNAVGLLFWPSIVINEVTGETAEREATDRLVELRDIYAAKECSKKDCADKQNG